MMAFVVGQRIGTFLRGTISCRLDGVEHCFVIIAATEIQLQPRDLF
jgi:hypothetical protein